MDWRAVVRENWPYKVAAAVLAVLLWLNVAAEERQEFPVPTDVQVELQDDAWVLVDTRPSQIRTVFQGRRGPVMPRMPVVRLMVDSVTAPRMELEVTPRMVRGFDRELDLRPVTVRPQTVELHFEPRVSARVPVEPRLTLSSAPGFTVARPVLLQPDTVTVGGAESDVSAVSSVPTEEAVLEELRRSVTRELQLVTPEGLGDLEVQPRTVLATVEVDTLVDRSVVRPLGVRGRARGAVAVPRESVEVRLRGPGEVVGSVDPAGVRAWVTVDEAPNGPTRLPVEVEVPGDPDLTVDANPSEVTVRPRGGGAAQEGGGP